MSVFNHWCWGWHDSDWIVSITLLSPLNLNCFGSFDEKYLCNYNCLLLLLLFSTDFKARMHSSRMHTARSSSRLLGWSASVHAGIHPSRPGPGHHPPGLDTPQLWACRQPQPDPPTSPRVWA